MAENKTKPTKVSASKYIAEIGDEAKRADAKTLVKLLQDVTGEKAAMWGPSIVGFGSYHYKYDSGREGDALDRLLAAQASDRSLWSNGICRCRYPVGKTRQTHDGQGLSLHQEPG